MKKKTMPQTLRTVALLAIGAVAIAASTLPRMAAAEASHKSFNLLGESVGLVGYEMAVLVERCASALTPALVAELQTSLPR